MAHERGGGNRSHFKSLKSSDVDGEDGLDLDDEDDVEGCALATRL